MKWLLETMVGRTVAVLLLGIVTLQLTSLWVFENTLSNEVSLANEERLGERIAAIYHAINRAAPPDRDPAAHDFAGTALEAHWGHGARAVPSDEMRERFPNLRARLADLLPEAGRDGIIIGVDPTNDQTLHVAVVSVKLPDQSWLNVGLMRPHVHPERSYAVVVSTSLMAAGIILISIFLVRWLAQPLELFASAARKLYASSDTVQVPNAGPREVRALADAFNGMQDRIRRLMTTRTHALAAVSHDLKTPLTRLRFRVDDVHDASVRGAIEADLAEMERMIDATLSYLRGDRAAEEMQPVDLLAIIETIAADAHDAGLPVTVALATSVVVRGRHLALKRAITNVVQNAVKYGGRADISLMSDRSFATVRVADAGPGIPQDRIESMFEPFVRLDESRNRDTGGFGLGLAIASEVVRSHGGSITLENRPEGGLVAEIRLPCVQ